VLAALALVSGPASAGPPSPADAGPLDSLAHYYATQDAAAVARLLAGARTREERLLCRYRLYPLTRDESLVADIPSVEGVRSAREAALIAGLWGFRAAQASPLRLPTYGRRSEGALNHARRLNPDEPYVLLIEGQSLLYKPAIFGGDPHAAQGRFERLRDLIRGRRIEGMDPIEPEVWVWMTLRRQRSSQAEPLRRRLLARNPPPLFRQFLTDPP